MSNMLKSDANLGTIFSYTMGYVLSLELTLAAYLLTKRHVDSLHQIFAHRTLVITIITLAIAQLLVQLVFFLHLGRGSNRRWNITVLAFAAIVLLIVVLGSLWIMNNLNYHMTPEQVNQYLRSQGGL